MMIASGISGRGRGKYSKAMAVRRVSGDVDSALGRMCALKSDVRERSSCTFSSYRVYDSSS